VKGGKGVHGGIGREGSEGKKGRYGRLWTKTHVVENRHRFFELKSRPTFGTCVIRKRLRFSAPMRTV